MKKLLILSMLIGVLIFSCEPTQKENNVAPVETPEVPTISEEVPLKEHTKPKIEEVEEEEFDIQSIIDPRSLEVDTNFWRVEEKYVQQVLQNENPNILDYFYALPQGAFFSCDCDLEDRPSREDYLIRHNVKAGYVLARDGCDNMDLAIVLYKDRQHKKDIIAVDYVPKGGDYFCGVNGPMGLFYLTPEGKWKNVTKELIDLEKLWQTIKSSDYTFRLPEQGTTIEVVRSYDLKAFGKLHWKIDHFDFEPHRSN